MVSEIITCVWSAGILKEMLWETSVPHLPLCIYYLWFTLSLHANISLIVPTNLYTMSSPSFSFVSFSSHIESIAIKASTLHLFFSPTPPSFRIHVFMLAPVWAWPTFLSGHTKECWHRNRLDFMASRHGRWDIYWYILPKFWRICRYWSDVASDLCVEWIRGLYIGLLIPIPACMKASVIMKNFFVSIWVSYRHVSVISRRDISAIFSFTCTAVVCKIWYVFRSHPASWSPNVVAILFVLQMR
jgi:hypothetical protein